MIKKLLAMACIAAMLLAPVRAQAFEVYSGDQVPAMRPDRPHQPTGL